VVEETTPNNGGNALWTRSSMPELTFINQPA
jgi:hypothetical protein